MRARGAPRARPLRGTNPDQVIEVAWTSPGLRAIGAPRPGD